MSLEELKGKWYDDLSNKLKKGNIILSIDKVVQKMVEQRTKKGCCHCCAQFQIMIFHEDTKYFFSHFNFEAYQSLGYQQLKYPYFVECLSLFY